MRATLACSKFTSSMISFQEFFRTMSYCKNQNTCSRTLSENKLQLMKDKGSFKNSSWRSQRELIRWIEIWVSCLRNRLNNQLIYLMTFRWIQVKFVLKSQRAILSSTFQGFMNLKWVQKQVFWETLNLKMIQKFMWKNKKEKWEFKIIL